MDMNITNNPFRKNTYNDYFYWENKIIKEHPLFEGYFDEEQITKNSKIVYTGILNSKKDAIRYGWAAYPSIYALAGFIKHVFLPSAFFNIFDCNSNGFFIPVAPFDFIFDEVSKNTTIDMRSASLMQKFNYTLDEITKLNEKNLSLELEKLCEAINTSYDNDPNQKIFIKVFDNPSDIFEFVKNFLGWEDEEFIEQELSMTLNTFKFTCSNVLYEPLLNKKFIDILNSNIPILF